MLPGDALNLIRSVAAADRDRTNRDEWGDPPHKCRGAMSMKSYTLYENVTAQPYSPILALASSTTPGCYPPRPPNGLPAFRPITIRASGSASRPRCLPGNGGVSGRYKKREEALPELA